MVDNKKILLLIISFIYLIFISVSYLSYDWIRFSLLLLSSLPLLFLFVSWIISYKSKLDLLSPLILLAYSLILGTFLRTFFLIQEDSGLISHQNSILYQQDLNDLIYPLFLIHLTISFFLIGYFQKKRFNLRINTSNRFFLTNRVIKRILWFTLLISLLGMILLVQAVGVNEIILENLLQKKRVYDESGQTYSFGPLRFLASFCMYGSFLGIINLFQSNYKSGSVLKILLLINFILSILYGLITSSRTTILFYFITCILIYVKITNKLSRRLIVTTVISLLTISTVISSFRNINHAEKNQLNPVYYLVANNNNLGVSKTGKIFSYSQKIDNLLLGSSYASWIFTPIPRSLWKDKPSITIGNYVRDKIMPGEGINAGAIPPGITGEILLNFGVFGLFIIPFLWGILIKSIYIRLSCLKTNNNPLNIIILSVLLIEGTIKLAGGSFTQMINGFLEALVTLFILQLLFIKKIKNEI